MNAICANPQAAELQSRPSLFQRGVLWLTLSALIAQPVTVSAQIVAATTGQYKPQIETAANGVTVIQITAPSATGVSRNEYQQFNVSPKGVVLNNSVFIVQTQQAGYIEGNPNLAEGSARIILNEITSGLPSSLRGYTEVGGARAEVIIANPNGITCDGCGFINTSRGVLTTGTPVFGTAGSLEAFRVTSGNIAINGAGLSGNNTDQIDLIARAVQVNTELWGETLNAITGANQVAYADLGTQGIAGSGAAPAVSIDVALLGGMYANKIRLVSSEAGVGVASSGTLATQAGGLSIDSAGRVTLGGSTQVGGRLDLRAQQDINNSGATYAQGTAQITSQGQFVNSGTLAAQGDLVLNAASLDSTGTLAAGANAQGVLSPTGSLRISTVGSLRAIGQNRSGGDLTLTGSALHLAGARTNASGSISLSADGDFDHSDAVLQSGGNLTLSAGGTINNDRGIVSAGQALSSRSASVSNQAGQILQNGSANSQITTSGQFDNRGGIVASNGSTALMIGNLDNRGGALQTQGSADLILTASGRVDNDSGQLVAGGATVLNAAELSNIQGKILAGQTLGITTARSLDNRQGTMAAMRDIGLDTPGINNSSGIIKSQSGSVTINAAGSTLDNTAGRLWAGKDLTLGAGTIANAGGELYAAWNAGLTANSYTGNGTLLAGNDLTINLNGNYTQSAANIIKANRHLTFSLSGNLINQGILTAVGNLALSAANIDNQAGATLQGASASLSASQTLSNAGTAWADALNLQANDLINTGSIFGKTITASANTLTNQGSGVVAAGNTLNLYVTNTLSNLDGGLLYSAGDLAIAGSAHRDTNGWLDTPSAHLLNRSASIDAGRDLEITTTTVDNQRTNLVTATRTLSTSTVLAQELDGAWSGSWIGRIFPNGITTVDPITGESTIAPYGAWYWHIDASAIPTFTILNLERDARRYAILSEQTQDYIVSATPEARMLAGRDLYLRAGTVNNSASRIAATRNLNSVITTLNNTGVTLHDKTRSTTWNGGCSDIQGDSPGHLGRCDSGWIWTAVVSDTITGTNTSLAPVFSGTQTLTLSAVTVNNSTVDPQGLVPGGVNLSVVSVTPSPTPATVFTVPSGGLYTLHAAPGARYLVETDPRFTQYARFISSDYLLSRLGLDPATTQKRLGDGFYEQQLVREQLINQRGQRRIGSYASLDADYQAMLEAGADFARAFDLRPGVTLSPAQIAGLAHDLVWLEERLVEGQRVLVPVVYLAQHGEATDTRASGALIGGGVSTQITAVDINNQGTIAARDQTTLIATHDLRNDSGRISGQRVTLAAGSDLHLGTATQRVTVAPGQEFTHEGVAGRIDGQSVTLVAGRDLTLAGGTIEATDATLSARRDLSIGTQSLVTEQHLQNGDSRYDRSARSGRASQVATTGDLTLSAGNDLTVGGSTLRSEGNLTGSAGNNLILSAAADEELIAYNAKNKRVSDRRQSERSDSRISTLEAGKTLSLKAGKVLASEGAMLRAGDDITLAADTVFLDAAHDRASSSTQYSHIGKRGQQQLQSQIDRDTATGSIVDAGRHLRMESTGDTTVIGSALAAGDTLTLKTGGDLKLLAAQSRSSAEINAYGWTTRKATTLNYSDQELRQLLTTITVGKGLALAVGGDFQADTGERNADGALNADHMTVKGIEKGDARQQVSVKRTGEDASANPTNSQVRGDLTAQGLRSGSNESFAPTAANAAQTGNAALQQYLNSGLTQIKGNPQALAQVQAVLQNSAGRTLTYKDVNGQVSLTVAGQAQVQAVYNTLKLTESFDTKKFADQGIAQIVTLVAAIALTVCTAGAGVASIGATLAGSGTMSAAMINAAVVSMASTMTGQLAGGASFGDAFEAGIKAGATSALTAGVLNAQVIDTAQGMQSINQLANVQTTGANIVGSFSADTFGQNLMGMAARGVVNAGVSTAINGGRFGDAFKSSLVSDLAAVGANAVGLSTDTLSPKNIIGHAAVGAVAAQLKGQDALSGAIGGAGAAIVNPLLDQAIGGADGSGWGSDPQSAQQMQTATLQLGSMAVSGGVAAALGKDAMTAALAAQNETVNNFLTKENIVAKQTRLAAARTPEDRAAIVKEYIGVSRDNRNKAFSDLKSTAMTEADLDQKRTELQNLLTGPLTPAAKADALYSISEINGIIASAHTGEKLEPVLLAVDLGLALLTAGESVLGKFAVRTVGELAEVVGANSVGDLSQAAIRARVEANLADSAVARASSNFNTPKIGLPAREWPPYPGSVNQIENDFVLLPGSTIDRFGPPQGTFLSPVGTPYSARALKPGTMADDYYVYEVLRPLPVKAGEIRPWFSETGGGTQFRLDAIGGTRRTPSTLTTGDNPYLKEIFKGKYSDYE